METKTYVLMGRPIPLSRPRFSHITKHVFDSQKEERTLAIMSLVNQHDNAPMMTGPLHLDVTFYMPIPQRENTKKKTISGQPHCKKPDLDNLEKWIGDIASNVIYPDDALIASISSKKVYDVNPRTEFSVRALI